jgi:hypothetical protein
MKNERNAIKIRLEVAEKVNRNAKEREKQCFVHREKLGEQKVRE